MASPYLAAQRNIEIPSGRSVERATRWMALLAMAVANLLGTAAVFVLLVWVLPTRDLQTDNAPILVNLVIAVTYVMLMIPLGLMWAARRLRPGRDWLKEERPPTRAEQVNLLRAPLHVMLVVGVGWLVAAFLFGIYNTTYSFTLGQQVFFVVLLGGLATCVAAYLLCELLFRPAAARALAGRPLDKPALPGVTFRSLFAWGIGSGIPLLGLMVIAISTLLDRGIDKDQLAIAVLSIAGGALLVGFFAVLLAARVTAAPILAVRRVVNEVERGEYETEVPVYDGTEVGLLQSGVNRMLEGLRERERIRTLFGMHVGQEVAVAALEQDPELGGEQRTVAVLFVDLVGSTKIASELPPSEVVDLLNRFFGRVVEVVDSCGGWVNKFEGDAALAIFGAPAAIDDPAGAALRAGRELRAVLDSGELEADAGIGVSYGEVVAGNIGSDQRFEYTVIGDAVNEAARLTELSKQRGGLLASRVTIDAAAAAEADRWEDGGEVELRGRGAATGLALPRAAGPSGA